MSNKRIISIDLLRGLVIVIMALDHVRDMVHPPPPGFDFGDADIALFLTRWITHLCAPTFILLAGISAYLYGASGRTKKDLSRFLVTRGIWLIIVELTLINFAVNLNFSAAYVPFIQVIWAIGASMLFLALLVWLPISAIAIISIGTIVGHNLLDSIQPNIADASAWWIIFHMQAPLMFSERAGIFVLYPLIPWVGVMGLGYVVGPIFDDRSNNRPEFRPKLLISVGMIMILSFVIFRLFSFYGEPNSWAMHDSFERLAVDFLHTTKYPPSLQFLLMTLGPAFVLLGLFEKCTSAWFKPLLHIGRVPFFFYVVHLYFIHLVSIGLGVWQGFEIKQIAVAFIKLPADFGVSLGVAYLYWILIVAALYPACYWFSKLKERRREWWLSYL